MTEKIYVHVDMDAFFISVEERATPSLARFPSAVAGPGRRGIITTSNYKARERGVRTGMTVSQARSLCRELTIVRADFPKYADASERVMGVLEILAPDLSVCSVDEAWFDGTPLLSRFGSGRTLGQEVKERVLRETGLTCSVGIGPSRLLAKLASAMEKPDGLRVIDPDEVQDVMKKLPVERIPGIGPCTFRILRGLGIRNCGQLGEYPLDLLKKLLGKRGPILSVMARGFDPEPCTGARREGGHQSVGHSVTLPEDTTDMDYTSKVVLTLSEMVGRRARKNGFAGRCVTITWRYADMTTHSRQRTLPFPVSRTSAIYRAALGLFDSVEVEQPLRLLGVSVSAGAGMDSNLPLFMGSPLEDGKEQRLQDTLDSINDRFGEFTMSFADAVPDLKGRKVISPGWRGKGLRRSD